MAFSSPDKTRQNPSNLNDPRRTPAALRDMNATWKIAEPVEAGRPPGPHGRHPTTIRGGTQPLMLSSRASCEMPVDSWDRRGSSDTYIRNGAYLPRVAPLEFVCPP
jgi:hypothetical protein